MLTNRWTVGLIDRHKMIPTHGSKPTTKLCEWGHNYDDTCICVSILIHVS